MNDNTNNDPVMTEYGTSVWKKIISILVLLILVTGASFAFYWYYTNVVEENQVVDNSDNNPSAFEQALGAAADKLGKDNESALIAAKNSLASATNPIDEGRAKLTLGLVQLRLDTREAIATLKEVSVNEQYHQFTRARAVWYTVFAYIGTDDLTVAENYIYTGDVWSDFLPDASNELTTKERMNRASANALEYSLVLYATPQAVSQLAIFKAKQILNESLDAEQREKTFASIDEQIQLTNELLDRMDTVDQRLYAATSYVVNASTLDNIAIVLDILHQADVDVSADKVEAAYHTALDQATQYELSTDHEYRVRYHLANFLLRENETENKAEIISILEPFASLSTQNYLAHSFRNQLTSESNQQETGNIIRLSAISPAFKKFLLAAGIPNGELTEDAY